MKPSRKILGIRLRNFDSGISKEMNWVGAILDYLDEQAESQEPKALEEEEEWTHNLAAREMKRDFPEETAGFNLDQIAEMYSEWSEENYCAGWMAPCKEYVARCFGKAKPQEEPCKECHAFLGHARRCSMRRDDPKDYGFRDHRHCPEKDSPCGVKGKHPCCLCGTKPQEEPYKWDIPKLKELGKACNKADSEAKKETEPKECPDCGRQLFLKPYHCDCIYGK